MPLSFTVSRNHTAITDALAAYIRQVSVREPDALRRLRQETAGDPEASIQVAPEQGQLLHFLVSVAGARNALEIGVLMGYSSTWMALALPSDGKLVACEENAAHEARARRTWREAGVESKIDLRLAPALRTLDGLLAEGRAGAFDFAFIDADKENYDNYYERCLLLLRPGGIVAADNVLWHGNVADPDSREPGTEAIRAFNHKLHADARVAIAMAALGDGMMLACKR